MLNFISTFGIERYDCVAVVGSGGKSTLICQLAQEAQNYHYPTIITTTTHIHLPFLSKNEYCCEIKQPTSLILPDKSPLVVFLKKIHPQKAKGIPAAWIDNWKNQGLILVESDGSRNIPFKIPAPWEPIIPDITTHTIIVVGLSALGKPLLSPWIHRLELLYKDYPFFPVITPQIIAHIIINPHHYIQKIPKNSKISLYLAGCQYSCQLSLVYEISKNLLKLGFPGNIYTGNLVGENWIQKT